tara:strand:- start:366 stop:809 length:444 start_codon:yes stop_codon:yes gene_type:complete
MVFGSITAVRSLFKKTSSTTTTTTTPPKLRCGVSSARNLSYHETDNNLPPVDDDKLPEFGSYCIKASVDLVDRNQPEGSVRQKVYEITGYDDNLEIQAKVNQVCRAYKNDDDTLECVNEKLVFLGPKRNCDGNITVLDVLNDQTFFF